MYQQNLQNSERLAGVAKLCADTWNSMKVEEKQIYYDMAKKDSDRYHREMR